MAELSSVSPRSGLADFSPGRKPGVGSKRITESRRDGRTQAAIAMKYAVIYEKSTTGYSAYIPDLPGCVAAAATLEEAEQLIRDAVAMHLEGMREDGDAIPEPSTVADYVTVFS